LSASRIVGALPVSKVASIGVVALQLATFYRTDRVCGSGWSGSSGRNRPSGMVRVVFKAEALPLDAVSAEGNSAICTEPSPAPSTPPAPSAPSIPAAPQLPNLPGEVWRPPSTTATASTGGVSFVPSILEDRQIYSRLIARLAAGRRRSGESILHREIEALPTRGKLGHPRERLAEHLLLCDAISASSARTHLRADERGESQSH
jgi:hypothetical protein